MSSTRARCTKRTQAVVALLVRGNQTFNLGTTRVRFPSTVRCKPKKIGYPFQIKGPHEGYQGSNPRLNPDFHNMFAYNFITSWLSGSGEYRTYGFESHLTCGGEIGRRSGLRSYELT